MGLQAGLGDMLTALLALIWYVPLVLISLLAVVGLLLGRGADSAKI
ncbi:MAG: hypothetical protein KJ747_11015 [Actinobacteria bacterium]|nr:hypothetical protein [Actinomycetota bacterium]MCG2808242.1 hypothetical protein [Coriobacteriia bacterium]